MAQYTHQTAPTQFVNAAGVRFAYRRFGEPGGVPLVFNIHFLGTMDHWDPAVTDGFAKDREVILFDNTGISSRSGEVPTSVEQMAADAAAFIKALGLIEVDVLWIAPRTIGSGIPGRPDRISDFLAGGLAPSAEHYPCAGGELK